MDSKNYIVAVDLGSSSVLVGIATKNADELLEIATIVKEPSNGVNAGRIENIALVRDAIENAIRKAEAELGIKISEVYTGISGEGVRCAKHTDHVFSHESQYGISQVDMDSLFDRMKNVQAPDDEVIMERSPQNYMVDECMDVEKPVGRFGKKLSSTFNFVLADKVSLQRLDMAIKQLGISLLGTFPNAIAAAEATLSNDEKEEGVALVDIGGGVTNVAVYQKNVLRHLASIPIGAHAINRDIRSQSIPERYVENLKIKYGSAVAELAPEKIIRIKGRVAKESQEILLTNLGAVIEARLTDIAELVMQELQESGFDKKLSFGIVLTGGCASLNNIDELFRRKTSLDVRVGTPDVGISEHSAAKIMAPEWATLVGLLLRGAKEGGCMTVQSAKQPEAQAASDSTTGKVAINDLYQQPNEDLRDAHSTNGQLRAIPTQPSQDEEQDAIEKQNKKKSNGLGKFFKNAINKIGDGFNAPDDEII